jgi:hypothetical protein
VLDSASMVMNPLPERSIQLTTYLGNDIPNSIDLDPTAGMIALARDAHAGLINTVGVRQVGPPTGRYNCHGLVFASRRTGIPAPGVDTTGLIDRVPQDDQFARVLESEVREGDVALWRQEREVAHTGIVCYTERVPIRLIFVWSMWGGLGEFVHRIPLSPYDGTIEYWRLT